MKKIYYFYKITNYINNKYYYGVHSTTDINDNYMGSGKRIKYAIKKYGINNFDKKILKYFNKYEDAFEYESNIVTENILTDNNCYNIALGGNGGFYHIDNNGKMPVIDLSGNTFQTNVNNKEIGISLFYIHINKTLYKNKEGKIYQLDVNDNKINELNLVGINKDKILVKDKDKNCYIVDVNDERLKKGELSLFWMGRKHKEESKIKIGQKNSKIQKGKGNSQYGTCWIFNEELKENKKIKKEELEFWINKNWQKGRKIKWGCSSTG